jgi:methyl-accepting chemotaxis protein
VNASGETLGTIVASVKKVSDIVSEISAANSEQSSGIDQVNKAVMSMDQVTQQNAALVEQAAAAAQSLLDQARVLSDRMARYKVGGASVASAPPAAAPGVVAAGTPAKRAAPAPVPARAARKAAARPVAAAAGAAHATEEWSEF